MVAVHRLHALAPTASRSGRPALRVIEGGANSSAPAVSPVSLAVVLAVMATMVLVVTVRGVQGAPPASDWGGLAGTPAASTVAAELVGGDVGTVTTYTVAEGDTWATIAAQVAPGADVVEVARQLASVNGGYAIEPGQSLVVELTAPVGG